MYNFDDRIELLRTVSKVAIRQLAVQRTPEMMDSIYRYAAEPALSCFVRYTRPNDFAYAITPQIHR